MAGQEKNIYDDIRAERCRQDKKFGEQRHEAAYWLAILMEEIGEAARAINEQAPEQYRKEMIQAAAVIVNALGSFDGGLFGAVPWGDLLKSSEEERHDH